jgi:phasin family protein
MTDINFEKMNETMSKMGQSAYNTAKALYDINTNTLEQLFDQHIAITTLGMESTARQMELMGKAKDYQAFIEGQADIANDFGSKSQGITRNTLDIMNESKEEVTAFIEKTTKEAADNFEMIKAA